MKMIATILVMCSVVGCLHAETSKDKQRDSMQHSDRADRPIR